MSLLMDALRKAEQQKQKLAAQGGEAAQSPPEPASASGGLSLEPLHIHRPEQEPSPPPSQPIGQPSHLPELPSSLEALDEQFLAHAAASKVATPPPAPPRIAPAPPPPVAHHLPAQAESKPEPKPDVARDNVRNVFEAKHPPAKNNRNFALAIGLISLVAAVGIGGYFWWQLQPKGLMVATNAPPRPASPPAAPAPIAPVAPVATTPQPVASQIQAPAAVAPAPTFAAADERNDDETPRPAKPVRQAVASTALPTAEPKSPFQRTVTPPKTDPLLIQAHQAFGRGEHDLARSAWQKALANDARNLDALRGLAVVAQQQQQYTEAAGYYQRALEVDPKDSVALAGLIALRVPTDALQTESRLKTLLAEQPNSAYLNFALGNQLARQQRWAEAQQAYFKSYSVEPTNPDYAFNLAVSLDQLHQSKLAAQYYNEALMAADKQPGQPVGFARADVQARLKQLQPIAQP